MVSFSSNNWLKNVINHVFLPPKLPGCDDEGENAWESRLVSVLSRSLEQFCAFEWPASDLASIILAFDGIKEFKALSLVDLSISASDLATVLDRLKTEGEPRPQNAGVVIHSAEKKIIFEMFELAPTNEAVFATKGRLQRQFPAVTVSLSRDTLDCKGLCKAISTLIGEMSMKAIPEMQPQIKKAGELQAEVRDTTKPHIVTELLAASLRPFGVMLPGRQLCKNTREEVRYEFGNKLPWRRSPVWLLLRVMLQLTLAGRLSTQSLDDRLYKKFMVYFMAQILEISLEADLSSDTIYAMNAKIARRIHKLDLKQTEPWMLPVSSIMRDATARLQRRWQTVVEQDEKSLPVPKNLHQSLDYESRISLPNLERFLHGIGNRMTNTRAKIFTPSSGIMPVSQTTIPFLRAAQTGEYTVYNLVAFENWVAQCLQPWIKENLLIESTCLKLHSTIKDYFQIAADAYKSRPEGQSIMLLTLLELWVACDKSATAIHPLLCDYDPEVPVETCSSLLLRFRSHMKRLSAVERYIEERRQKTTHQSAPIFTSFGTAHTFAVCFYDSSPSLQKLLARIEEYAQEMEEQKRSEFRQLKSQHDSLVEQSEAMTHLQVMITDKYGDQHLQHPTACLKCRLLQQAAEMTIEINEWPLPRAVAAAKSVVFELDVPLAFQEWRDCTYFLRKCILGPERDVLGSSTGTKYSAPLDTYAGLASFGTFHKVSGTQLVTIASSTKPNVLTHRSPKEVAIC
ncbi:unnamed protein product [Clonostachys rosea f. rosea IK726]|uniref:Uncharacterized protein n=1 Tax=Clonostachys rosea f. rosea IK726 TaxID=1349383 RepID=A0ACA9U836_BIOOC|nr:unnamed protein product [Clonostachys rosea f. rosea IK726]